MKSRGQDYDAGRHTLRITAGSGLEVFRRAPTPPRDLDRVQPTSSTRQSVIGSGPLDELFGGRVFDGSVTMVVGISGVGKTVLGTQLLLEGAVNQKRGLMVSLDEHPEQVMRAWKCRSNGPPYASMAACWPPLARRSCTRGITRSWTRSVSQPSNTSFRSERQPCTTKSPSASAWNARRNASSTLRCWANWRRGSP